MALHDLGVVVRSKTSINLLDIKHYRLTMDQLQESLNKGSLFQKRRYVVKRLSPPTIDSNSFKIAIDTNAIIPNRARSIHEINEENYEELIVSDELFAEENADTVEMDNPINTRGFQNVNKKR